MPIDIAEYLPFAPLHWTSINHYLVLLAALGVIMTAGPDVSIWFLLSVGVMALSTGFSLYMNYFNLPRLYEFIIRTLIFGLPVVLAGLSKSEQTRGVAVMASILAFPILVMTFATCFLGGLGDPRILASWC